jgi:hypothetical protein
MAGDPLLEDALQYARRAFPGMRIDVAPWARDPARVAITFVDASFAPLYPAQRWHRLAHVFPREVYDRSLADTIWFPLAPGETPDELVYPDDETIAGIDEFVMKALEASGALAALDDALCPERTDAVPARCHGDFRHARAAFAVGGFSEDELFDVFHVLMARGGWCDCEILYNAVESSRLKGEYWTARAEGREPRNPHAS